MSVLIQNPFDKTFAIEEEDIIIIIIILSEKIIRRKKASVPHV